MKFDEETGGKRKLSKRKDPELSLDYYRKDGYHPYTMKVYLLHSLTLTLRNGMRSSLTRISMNSHSQ